MDLFANTTWWFSPLLIGYLLARLFLLLAGCFLVVKATPAIIKVGSYVKQRIKRAFNWFRSRSNFEKSAMTAIVIMSSHFAASNQSAADCPTSYLPAEVGVPFGMISMNLKTKEITTYQAGQETPMMAEHRRLFPASCKVFVALSYPLYPIFFDKLKLGFILAHGPFKFQFLNSILFGLLSFSILRLLMGIAR